uniref:Uncharacterized protein n=1 Tax=Anguilla anguilla TaxID=7936 RepID=A0A0E9VW45_ANGAN
MHTICWKKSTHLHAHSSFKSIRNHLCYELMMSGSLKVNGHIHWKELEPFTAIYTCKSDLKAPHYT